jgi:sulfotransferase
MKDFYFLAGLPRSGSTLLTALLNQNSTIYASEVSPVAKMMGLLYKNIEETESFKADYRKINHINCVKEIPNSFYSDIKKPIVIDKSRAWGAPFYFNLAQLVNPNTKIILTVRPILEILASIINLCNKNPNNNIDLNLQNEDFYSKYYKDLNDARCEYIMRAGGELDLALLSVANSLNHPENFHIVWYDDLTNNPQNELNKVYDFLKIEKHKHNLQNIKSVDKLNDIQAFGFHDLHKVNSKIEKSKTSPSESLSSYIINKYGSTLNFLSEGTL